MRTAAWRDLDCVARCAYVELTSRYAGPSSNNGRIPYSLREMADNLNVSKATAMRALARLQDHGFVVMAKKGAFRALIRVASEWRLTEFADDTTGEIATKDFVKWQPKNKTPFHVETHVGVEMKPDGCRDETREDEKTPLRFHHETQDDDSWFHQRDTSSLPGSTAQSVSDAVRGSDLVRAARGPQGSQRRGAPAPDLDATLRARIAKQNATRSPKRSATADPDTDIADAMQAIADTFKAVTP